MSLERGRSLSDWVGEFGERFLSSTSAVVGTVIVATVVLASVAGPVIIDHGPRAIDSGNRLSGPAAVDESNDEYLLGTDNYGRDLLSRVLVGGRWSLLLGVSATGLGLAGGAPIGLVTGYVGGRTDGIVMRIMDAVMSFPSLLLALLLLTMLPSNVWTAVVAIGVAVVPRIARVIRAATASVRHKSYVTAAEARGESDVSILLTEIGPNVVSPVLVEASIRIGFAILLGSSLSFLGLGVQPPTPSWGTMIASARLHTYESGWFLLWPTLMLGFTVLGFNLLGDGLRDVFDTQTTTSD